MTRRKVEKTSKLARRLTIRMSDSFYKRLESWFSNSDCRTISELARSILYREEIVWKHKDESLESVVIELEGIRKELNAMGRNINQITHHFHTSDTTKQKLFASMDIQKTYDKVGERVSRLLTVAESISKKWLQG